jgi:hypothetical protein
MAANAQGMPGVGAPVPPGDIHNLSTIIQIFRTLGGVTALEAKAESHTQKIEQLTQQVYAIPYIKEDVAKNTKDLSDLGGQHTKELNDLGQRLDKNVNELTKKINDLGIRLGKDISELRIRDIGDLKSKMDTAENIFKILLGILAVIVPLLWIYLSHHFSIVFHQ